MPFDTVASLECAASSTDGSEDGGKAGSGVRWFKDWYEVVMAVVTVDPFAMGVRYFVCVECRRVDGLSTMVEGFVI